MNKTCENCPARLLNENEVISNNIGNVYSKAESALEDRYISNISVYELANNILEFKKFVDDNKLIRQIVLELELEHRIHEIKPEYLKFIL